MGDTDPKAHPVKIDVAQKLTLFDERWSPRIIGDLSDAHVKLSKLQGEFVGHRHEAEDELFLVISGRLVMRFRDGEEVLGPGDLIVPRGVEHLPVADEGTAVLLVEPKTPRNTGDVRSERTLERLQRIRRGAGTFRASTPACPTRSTPGPTSTTSSTRAMTATCGSTSS